MTTNTNTKTPAPATTKNAPAAVEFNREDFNRTLALVKNEVSGIITDSMKKRPLYSKTVDEAVAKRDAVVKSFESFLDMIDSVKKQ